MDPKRILSILSVLALAGITVQAAEPSISCETDGTNLIITYTGTLLQSTDTISWTEVASASSPYKVKISDKKLFFCSQDGGEVQPVVPGENFSPSLPGGVSLDMIWIEPGTFIMGSPEDELGRWDDETQHEVTLTQGYWLGKYAVTQAQYEAVMETNPSYFKGVALPVEQVTWHNATNFCAKLTEIERAAGRLPEGYEYTLPTEAQWEYACRAGTTTALNSGKNLSNMYKCSNMDEVGCYGFNSGQYDSNGNSTGEGKTYSVGQKLPNAWGLYDMHGNVGEWCLDWYGNYPTSAVTDPTGPVTGEKRVMRGGSWYYYANNCRSAFRNYGYPNHFYGDSGFRVSLIPVK
jgi:formylglycine-generating enzyme required for sulfatase activity